MTSSTDYDHIQHERISLSSSWQDLTVAQSPELDCIIIPSFGEDPPGNVAIKLKMSGKMSSKFLEGVGEDLDIIQQLIIEDNTKHLREVRLMCHFAQKKVREFKKKIRETMKDLKQKRAQKGCKYST